MATSQGWRDTQKYQRSRGQKLARLGFASILVGAVVWLVLSLMMPFWHPRTRLVYAVAGSEPQSGVEPAPFALEQYARLVPLSTVLNRDETSLPNVPLISADSLTKAGWMDRAVPTALDDDDAILVYLAAGEETLGGSGEPGAGLVVSSQDGRATTLPIESVLEELCRLSAGTKVLILDTQTPTLPTPGTVLPGGFSHHLAKAVVATQDQSLWVLSAHSPLQQSHYSPALRRSVMAYFMARALKGDADLDQNRFLTLNELLQYVRAGVDDWVQFVSGGHATQTPQLIWGGGPLDANAPTPILLAVPKLPAKDREPDVQEAVQQASQPRQPGKWESVFRERAANRLRPLVNPIRDKLTEARIPELRSIARNSAASDSGTDASQATSAATTPSSTDNDAAKTQDGKSSAVATDATGAQAKSAEAGSGASGANETQSGTKPARDQADQSKSSSASDSGAEEIFPPDPREQPELLTELAEAWAIHDALLDPRRIDPRPIDVAPEWWRNYERCLLAVDQSIRFGWRLDLSPLKRMLRDELLPLAVLLDGQSIPDDVNGDLLSKWEQRQSVQMSSVSVHSLAAAEAVGWSNIGWSGSEKAAVKAFKRTLQEPNPEAFQQWMNQSWSDRFDSMVELRLARQVVSQADQDWSLIRQLLTCALSAERAAVQVAQEGLADDDLRQADRLFRQAVNWLVDPLEPNARRRARTRLNEAAGIYRETLSLAEANRTGRRLRNELIARLPYLVALQQRHADDLRHPVPSADAIEEAIELIVESEQRLESAPLTATGVQTINEQLRAVRTQLEQGIQPEQVEPFIRSPTQPSDSWYMTSLLSTPLLDATTRMRLIAVVAEAEAVHLKDYSPPSRINILDETVRRQDWIIDRNRAGRLANADRQVAQWMRWQSLWMKLASVDSTSLLSESLRRRVEQWNSKPRSIDQLVPSYSRLVADFWHDRSQWPVRLSAAVAKHQDLQDSRSRDDHCDRLRQIKLAIRALAIEPDALFDPAAVDRRLASSARYDLFVLGAERFDSDRQSVGPSDAVFLRSAADDYRRQAANEPLQPPVAQPPPPPLELVGDSQITFGPSEWESAAEVTVTHLGNEPADVWLVVQSDPGAVEVQSLSTENVYEHAALRAELRYRARQADEQLQRMRGQQAVPADIRRQAERLLALRQGAMEPLVPSAADLPPTFRLEPGQQKTVRLQVDRVGKLSQQTKVLVRAITGHQQVRWDVAVELPDRVAVGLLVKADQPTWSTSDSGYVLHPYPHRATSYRIDAINARGRDMDASIWIFAPTEPLKLAAPTTMLTRAGAEDWLARCGRLRPLIDGVPVRLPGNGENVQLLPELVTASASKKTSDASSQQTSGPPDTGVGGDGKDASKTPILLTHGLVFRIEDRDSGATTIASVDVSPQRPRRYTRPHVSYDATTSELTVRLDVVDDVAVAESGIPVQARISSDAADPLRLNLSGVISPQSRSLVLSANVAPEPDTHYLLEIDVDQFPRAFLYRFRTTSTQPMVAEWVDRNRLKILSPAAESAFGGNQSVIQVNARVDAPVGTFLDPRDQLEIGFDVDQDREFRDESPRQFSSDRQVRVEWLPGPPQPAGVGSMDLITRISDYQIGLEAGGLSNARVNILAHLRAGRSDVWSEPVEVILDGEPPELGGLRVLPSRRVPEATPLSISVSANDNDLSGVRSVQIGVAKPGTKEFAETPAAVSASRTVGGVWSAELDTTGLQPGNHLILAQAVDAVGNQSLARSAPLEILSRAVLEAEAMQPKVVRGRVMHGSVFADGAIVRLLTVEEPPKEIARRTTDQQGRFRFAKVLPGEYQLSASGVVKNNPRNGTESLTVPKGKTQIDPIEMKIE